MLVKKMYVEEGIALKRTYAYKEREEGWVAKTRVGLRMYFMQDPS